MKLFGLHIPRLRWIRPDPTAQVRQLICAIEDNDAKVVKDLLAQGCPTSHPQVKGNAVTWVCEFGHPDLLPLVMQGRPIPQDAQELLFRATYDFNDAIALRLLKLGVSPVDKDAVLENRRLIVAIEVTAGKSDRRALLDAFMASTPQEQKDQLLARFVSEGSEHCVRALLAAGGNPRQLVNGRSLLDTAPDEAEAVQRMLRSIETGDLLESAMGGSEDAREDIAPPPERTFTL